MNKKLMFVLFALVLTLFGCNTDSSNNDNGSEAAETDYPTETIEIVVPWSAGGSSDLTARALAEAMDEVVDQNVVVTNREGAGGTIATTEVATQQSDAHTIL